MIRGQSGRIRMVKPQTLSGAIPLCEYRVSTDLEFDVEYLGLLVDMGGPRIAICDSTFS